MPASRPPNQTTPHATTITPARRATPARQDNAWAGRRRTATTTTPVRTTRASRLRAAPTPTTPIRAPTATRVRPTTPAREDPAWVVRRRTATTTTPVRT